MAMSEWIFILICFFFSAHSSRKYQVKKKKKTSTVKYGLHYSSPMKSSIHVSELIYSAKAEKTFVA